MEFIKPVGIIQCSSFIRVIMDVYNLFALMKIEGEGAFFSCFLLREWDEDEVKVLFKHVLDDDGIPFTDPSKIENIKMDQFINGLKLISNWLYNLDLPFLLKEELGFITRESIEKAVDRYIAYRKEQEADFEGFFTEAIKNVIGK